MTSKSEYVSVVLPPIRSKKKKLCKKCGRERTMVERPSGRRWVCIQCIRNISRAWYLANKQKTYERMTIWHAENYEKIRESRKKSDKKRSSNPQERISRSVSRRIRKSIGSSVKGGRHWECLVGFTVEQLKKRLESKFLPGMSWGNYGEWHIDHIVPVIAFNFERPEDFDFKKCWSLKNLQPMWAFDNMSKHDRIDKPFQPSLSIAG